MKRLCQELERHLESGVEHLPDALRAHLARCAKCQHTWRLHKAYLRALHAARREPTPACELPWSRIQAQLAARAVSRQPLAWLRPALGWGMAVAVALAIGAAMLPWGNQQPPQGETLAQKDTLAQTEQNLARETTADTSAVALAEPTQPPARIVAQAAPRLREPARLLPPAPETPQTNADAILYRRDISRIESRRLTEATRTPAFGTTPEQPITVASLPLTPFEVNDHSAGVEYLPISYSSPSSHHEGSNDEAVIGSF